MKAYPRARQGKGSIAHLCKYVHQSDAASISKQHLAHRLAEGSPTPTSLSLSVTFRALRGGWGRPAQGALTSHHVAPAPTYVQ